MLFMTHTTLEDNMQDDALAVNFKSNCYVKNVHEIKEPLSNSLITKERSGSVLTHWDRVTHICVNKLTIISSDLNQCWNIVNWTLGNKFQWNLNRNLNIFIQENAFENVVWKMAAMLSRPQCVNGFLRGESPVDRYWDPRTKGQWDGKRFHLYCPLHVVMKQW